MQPVEMPKANENMTEATLDRWLVREGQAVAEKEGLCVIITDKAAFDMPAPCAGTVAGPLAPEKSILPVGYILCGLGLPGETVPPDYALRNERILAAHRGATLQTGASVPSAAIANASAIRATPAARRVAKEAGVDLSEVVQVLGLSQPLSEKDILDFIAKRGRK